MPAAWNGPVVRLHRPVVLAAAGVVAELHGDRRPRRRRLQQRQQRRPAAGTGDVDLPLVAAAHHVEVDVQRDPVPGDRRRGDERLRALQPLLLGVERGQHQRVRRRAPPRSARRPPAASPPPRRCRRPRGRSGRRESRGDRSAPTRRAPAVRDAGRGHCADEVHAVRRRRRPSIVNENGTSKSAPSAGSRPRAANRFEDPRARRAVAGRTGGAAVHARRGQRLDGREQRRAIGRRPPAPPAAAWPRPGADAVQHSANASGRRPHAARAARAQRRQVMTHRQLIQRLTAGTL